MSCPRASTASAITACSPAAPERPISSGHAYCSPSRRRLLTTCPPNHRKHVRHAPAAAAAWWSSKPSSAGASPVRRLQIRHRLKGASRDPTRSDLTFSRSNHASGNRPARPGGTGRHRGQRRRPRETPAHRSQDGSISRLRPQQRPVQPKRRRLQHSPKTVFPITHRVQPRLPALEDIVRLPAPDILHNEFIRRFLLHVLPKGFHRIRHYGLLASGARKAHLERARILLAVAPPAADDMPAEPPETRPPCPCCGGRMVVIETFERWRQPRAPPSDPTPAERCVP